MRKENRLAIVVPCYNEQAAFPFALQKLNEVLAELIKNKKIAKNSFVLFVDDGSKDNTWSLIDEAAATYETVRGLKLAGNVGHQNALLAGLLTANEESDMGVSIDADLQDDVAAIEKMVDRYHMGYDVVYGVRSDRTSDSAFKRVTAQGFYKLMNAMGAKSIYNHADFRLMSHRAIAALSQYKERNLYLRGIVPLIGYPSDSVYYERSKRVAGESKYPLKKMLKFAFDGITSFSVKPIVLITIAGGVIMAISLLACLYSLICRLVGCSYWFSPLILSIWFFAGAQLFSVGLVGQYVGKIYVETKERPRYQIECYKK